MSKKTAFIVDDHPFVREGIVTFINQEADLQVCGEASTGREALSGITARKPDIVVVDLSLREGSGIELIKDIRAMHPATAILVLSMYDENLYASRVLQAGARGYVMKQANPRNVVEAIRKILGGELYVSPNVTRTLLQRLAAATAKPHEPAIDSLSDRELEILQLLGQGLGTREIAQKLTMSDTTVIFYRNRLKQRLHLEHANSLTRFAIQWARSQPWNLAPDAPAPAAPTPTDDSAATAPVRARRAPPRTRAAEPKAHKTSAPLPAR